MIEARCLRDCTWNGKYWKAGEVYRGGEKPPLHFAIVKDDEPPTPAPEEPAVAEGAEYESEKEPTPAPEGAVRQPQPRKGKK